MVGRTAMATAILPLILAACASTGVVPAGPDTYTLTEHFVAIWGDATKAGRVAVIKANDFCIEKGRVFMPSMTQASIPTEGSGNTEYTVTFQCLLPTDAALAMYR